MVSLAPNTNLNPTRLARTSLKILYPNASPLSHSHLTCPEIALLTRCLARHVPNHLPVPALPAYVQYSERTSQLISELPKRLLSPMPVRGISEQKTVAKLKKAGAGPALPRPAKLCSLHKRLNAQVLASALGMVEMEADVHIAELVTQGRKTLPKELLRCLRAAEDVLASRMPDEEFQHFFKRPASWRWISLPNADVDCDACVLSHVGSDQDVLVALRSSMLARGSPAMRSGVESFAALEWVEGWIVNHGVEGRKLLKVSDAFAELLLGKKTLSPHIVLPPPTQLSSLVEHISSSSKHATHVPEAVFLKLKSNSHKTYASNSYATLNLQLNTSTSSSSVSSERASSTDQTCEFQSDKRTLRVGTPLVLTRNVGRLAAIMAGEQEKLAFKLDTFHSDTRCRVQSRYSAYKPAEVYAEYSTTSHCEDYEKK